MHLSVLVDRRIDAQQQSGLVETVEMIMQVGIARSRITRSRRRSERWRRRQRSKSPPRPA
jgi:hypothetical protein